MDRFLRSNENDIESLRNQLLEMSDKISDISEQITVINQNIIILDEQNKRLNGVNEIICAVQQQMLDDLSYTPSESKKMHIFPFRKSEDDDLPN